MEEEKFLNNYCPNHTDESKWNKSELMTIMEEYANKRATAYAKYVNDCLHYLVTPHTFIDWNNGLR